MRRFLLLLPVLCLLLALPATAPAKKRKPKPPSTSLVTKMLKQRYTDFAKADVPAITKLKVTVGKLKFGRVRIGDQYKDGTPANTRTWVFPVKVKQATWLACNAYFTYKNTYTGGDFVFFRDDFGDWTFRGTDAKTDSTSLTSCPL